MQVRQSLGERDVIAPTMKRTAGAAGKFTKADFVIDTEGDVVRCPMGEATRAWRWVFVTPGADQSKVWVKRFAFAKEVCRGCARYQECLQDKWRRGRFITLHPQEAQLQAARAFERTDDFRGQYRQRAVVEHRLVRLMRPGVRQARYFGRAKTLLQLLLAATVANLTLVMGKLAHTTRRGGVNSRPMCTTGRRPRAAPHPRRISPTKSGGDARRHPSPDHLVATATSRYRSRQIMGFSPRFLAERARDAR